MLLEPAGSFHFRIRDVCQSAWRSNWRWPVVAPVLPVREVIHVASRSKQSLFYFFPCFYRVHSVIDQRAVVIPNLRLFHSNHSAPGGITLCCPWRGVVFETQPFCVVPGEQLLCCCSESDQQPWNIKMSNFSIEMPRRWSQSVVCAAVLGIGIGIDAMHFAEAVVQGPTVTYMRAVIM